MSAQTPVQKLIEGDPASPVRVLIYEDLQCPDSANFRKMMDAELIPRFGNSVAFEHRDFPLPKHAWARPAAIASRYFEIISPELAIEFRRATLAAQSNITSENFRNHVAAFAKSHQTDDVMAPNKTIAALNDQALNALVEANYQEGIARGVARTPTVLVNGDPFVETFPAADIIRSIEKELAAMQR